MIKLQTQNITKSYGSRNVIKDINIVLHENECVSLLGVSGIGKTTLFNIISGIIVPGSGKVYLDNADITGIAGKVGYMPQKDLLLPYKTIIENVSLPLIIAGKKNVGAAWHAARVAYHATPTTIFCRFWFRRNREQIPVTAFSEE